MLRQQPGLELVLEWWRQVWVEDWFTVLAGVAGAVVFVVSINVVALGLLALGTYLIAQG